MLHACLLHRRGGDAHLLLGETQQFGRNRGLVLALLVDPVVLDLQQAGLVILLQLLTGTVLLHLQLHLQFVIAGSRIIGAGILLLQAGLGILPTA